MKKLLVVLTLAFLFCSSGSEAVNIKDFAIKDGAVFKGKTRLDCEVNEISEGAVGYWSMIGPDSAGGAAVKDDEIGAGFFSREGACLAFVPLDSEEELQDVEFAPKGENFVIVRGSEIRPDMFCDVYVKGIKKVAELDMLRGSLIWLDPDRFIYTRIDGVRDGYARVLNGMRLSVSMYDASNQKESVLKESTGTQNFQLNEFENGQATITEEYVKNEKDWGDDAEPKEREIKLPIPANGNKNYLSYSNSRFGYSLEYPDIFAGKEEYADGDDFDNLVLNTEEGNFYTLFLVGGKAEKGDTGTTLLKERTNMKEDSNGYVYGNEPLPGTAKSGNGFYTLEYETDEGYLCYEYGLVDKKVKAVLTMRMKQGKANEKFFREICAALEKSFKLKK